MSAPQLSLLLFLTPTPPHALSTLSLHDALPISPLGPPRRTASRHARGTNSSPRLRRICSTRMRSEEHTSELQSRFDLVCRLLLEKKKNLAQPVDLRAFRHGTSSSCTVPRGAGAP